MAELLTEKIIIDALEADGISQEIDNSSILELIQEKNNSNLDITSSWAEGHEDLLLYLESTADAYEVYVCTQSHDKYINIEEDVHYYLDHGHFCETIIEVLIDGGNVWCDPNVWVDIVDEFDYALGDWYNDYFQDKKSEMKERLLSTGNYKI